MSDEPTTQPGADVANPAAGIDPASLDELMSRDPLDLSTRDLETIVEALTRARKAWEQEAASAPAPGAKTRSPAQPKKKISLEDLGL